MDWRPISEMHADASGCFLLKNGQDTGTALYSGGKCVETPVNSPTHFAPIEDD